MKYFEVELENPDEFLKLQTEDFVKANRLLLRKIIPVSYTHLTLPTKRIV